MNRKSIMMGAAVVTIVGATAFVSTTALAQETNGRANMITKLAQKLGVPEDKVKTAFDELHAERETAMKQNREQKLTTLVSEGKITEAQKEAILLKMEELRTKHQNMKAEMQNLTPEQRKEKMEAHRAELEAWAKEQGLDLSILPFGKMKVKHNGEGGNRVLWKFGTEPTTSPNPSS